MTGHFEKGVWVEDLVWSFQKTYTYPDIPSQLSVIIEKLAWIERQLMAMNNDMQGMKWELRWKK